MQADDTVEVVSPIDDSFDKYLELLPIFDKLDLDTSFRLSDSTLDDVDISDCESIDNGIDTEGTTPEEVPQFPSSIAPKAMKLLGETNDATPCSSAVAPKALKVLGVASFRKTASQASKKRPTRPSLTNDASTKFNLSKARQLLFRQSTVSLETPPDLPRPSKSLSNSSASTAFGSFSERSSKVSEPSSPSYETSLRAQLDHSSVQRVRKLMESLEEEAAYSDVNKPLPLAPRKQDLDLQEDQPLSESQTPSSRPVSAVHHLVTQSESTANLPRPTMGRKHVSQMMQSSRSYSATDNGLYIEAEGMALKIMLSIDSIDDVRAMAMVNKSFYQTFRRHETLIVSRAVLVSSPAAWELRQSLNSHMRPNAFRMKSVRRDTTSFHALEAFIVMRCRAVCRADTIQALLGGISARKQELEDALWRIWTFCKLFGKGSGVQEDFGKQVSWLNGGSDRLQSEQQSVFAIGNGSGVTMRELEDMSEMWRCMESLLAGFRGREEDARKAGVFDSCTITDELSETSLLQAWIYDMLSLGPKATLTLSSCDFGHAKVLGLTNWTPPSNGQNRQNFFKAAVEEVYRERLVADAQRLANEFKSTHYVAQHQRSASDSALVSPAPIPHRLRPPMRDENLKIETSTSSSPPKDKTEQPRSKSLDSEKEVRQEYDPISATSSLPSASAATNPMAFSSITLARNASTRLGSSLFPTHPALQSAEVAPPQSKSQKLHVVTEVPEVIDPTDRAIHKLVHEMGFPEIEAKRALAMSDSGTGINIEKAIQILSASKFSAEKEVIEMPAQLSPVNSSRSVSRTSSQRNKNYCEGTCPSKTVIIAEPKRDRVQGLGFVKRTMSVRKSFGKSGPQLDMIVDVKDAEAKGPTSPTQATIQSQVTSANRTRSFRQNGGGMRSSMPPALLTSFTPSPMFTRSTNDLTRPQSTRLTTLEELPSPSSVYSDTEAMVWPADSNGNGLWGALAAAAPSATPQPTYSHTHASTAPSEEKEAITPESPRARVTLTRVGTGKSSINNNSKPWRFGSVKKTARGRTVGSLRRNKEEDAEIIGYAY